MTKRLEIIDILRGVALIAMAIFHFAFDLQMFGYVEPHYVEQPEWKYFARSIASSFLVLTGFSLYLANQNGINWSAWVKREAKIIGAALLITIATWFATPSHYIFFGILHHIAFASLAGLLFVFVPAWITFITGSAVLWIGLTVGLEVLDYPVLFWTGLTKLTPVSNDFVPVFPWWSASLFGIAIAKYSNQRGWLEQWASVQYDQKISRILKLLGNHSLLFYLLHQPVLIGFVLAYKGLTQGFG